MDQRVPKARKVLLLLPFQRCLRDQLGQKGQLLLQVQRALTALRVLRALRALTVQLYQLQVHHQ